MAEQESTGSACSKSLVQFPARTILKYQAAGKGRDLRPWTATQRPSLV